jgi:N-acylneuraminate cytidylyltransferase
MIAYTIEAARESGIFARVIVSTDDPEVAEVSARVGAEVPFMRAAALADDRTTSSQVTADALEKADPVGDRYVYAAQLLPTCPLRIASDVENSFRQMIDTNASSQISVTRFGWLNPWWALRRDSQFRLTPLFAEATKQRSQDLPVLYEPVGAIWWAKAASLRRSRNFYMPDHTGWEISWERAVDIDTEEDWRMAELLKQRQLPHTPAP